MIIFTDIEKVNISEPTIVVIGKFDGDHIGHQKLFSEMRKAASFYHLKTAAVSFDISQIISYESKLERLEKEGVEYLLQLHMSKEIMSISGVDFLKNVLIGKMNMKAIAAGPDCAFGFEKSGNIELLNKYSDELDYRVIVVDKVKDSNGEEINSTAIRDLINQGQLDAARQLLGESGKYLSIKADC